MRALVFIVVALLGCKEKQPEAREVEAPTVQEAEAFGKDYARHLVPCNAAELQQRIDQDLMLARAFAKRRMSSAQTRSFKRGFPGVGELLCKQLSSIQNVDARYLRVLTTSGAPRPLIRLIMDGSLNYTELELDKHGGKVRAADLDIYMAGERMSETLGKLIDVLIDQDSHVGKTLERLNQQVVAQEWEEAHKTFQSLPADVRTSKPLRLGEIQIAGELADESIYIKAMDDFARAFPNDPALALVQIDRTIYKQQWTEALRVLDALDRRVGGDPYLDVFRADVYAGQGKLADALEASKRVTQKMPDLVAGWWGLLSHQAENKLFADAIPTLEKLRDHFKQDVSAETLAPDERFTALIESDEYKAWASGR